MSKPKISRSFELQAKIVSFHIVFCKPRMVQVWYTRMFGPFKSKSCFNTLPSTSLFACSSS